MSNTFKVIPNFPNYECTMEGQFRNATTQGFVLPTKESGGKSIRLKNASGVLLQSTVISLVKKTWGHSNLSQKEPIQTKPIKTRKVETPKDGQKAAHIKEKRAKTEDLKTLSVKEFTVGDKVSFLERKTKLQKTGEIIKINKHKDKDYILIRTPDKQQWVVLNKLTKI